MGSGVFINYIPQAFEGIYSMYNMGCFCKKLWNKKEFREREFWDLGINVAFVVAQTVNLVRFKESPYAHIFVYCLSLATKASETYIDSSRWQTPIVESAGTSLIRVAAFLSIQSGAKSITVESAYYSLVSLCLIVGAKVFKALERSKAGDAEDRINKLEKGDLKSDQGLGQTIYQFRDRLNTLEKGCFCQINKNSDGSDNTFPALAEKVGKLDQGIFSDYTKLKQAFTKLIKQWIKDELSKPSPEKRSISSSNSNNSNVDEENTNEADDLNNMATTPETTPKQRKSKKSE